MIPRTILIFALLSAPAAQARVFNLTEQKIASYFSGSLGLSDVKKKGFQGAGADGMTYGDEHKTNLQGEIGVILLMKRVSLILGLEILRPNLVENTPAVDAAGVTQYNLTSQIFAIGPKVAFQMDFSYGDNSRFFAMVGVGFHQVSLKNDFKFTTDGQTTYAIPDYIEEGAVYANNFDVALGYEFGFADNVTMVLDTGYRSFIAEGLVHSRSATGINGAISPGTKMTDIDGKVRKLDLSGIWVGLGFRFYINF